MTNFSQESPMDVYPIRLTAAHARVARREGNGNLSEGARIAIERLDAEYEKRLAKDYRPIQDDS